MNIPLNLEHLQAVVKHSCRRGCGYCYNDKLSQSTISVPENFCRAVKNILNQVGNPIILEVIGGEPLEPDIIDLTKQVVKIGYSHYKCKQVKLCTAIDEPSVISSLLPNINYVYLSVDCSSNKSNKKKLNKKRLFNFNELLVKSNTDLSISTVLYGDESQSLLINFINTLVEIGIKKVGFSYPYAFSLTKEEIDRFSKQFYWLYQLKLAMKNSIEIHGEILKSLDLYIQNISRFAYCSCGQSNAVLEPDGTLSMGICFDHEKEIPSNHKEIQERLLNRMEKLRQAEPCKSCNLWHVCYGGCSARGNQFNFGNIGRDLVDCNILINSSSYIDMDRYYMQSQI